MMIGSAGACVNEDEKVHFCKHGGNECCGWYSNCTESGCDVGNIADFVSLPDVGVYGGGADEMSPVILYNYFIDSVSSSYHTIQYISTIIFMNISTAVSAIHSTSSAISGNIRLASTAVWEINQAALHSSLFYKIWIINFSLRTNLNKCL